MFAYMVPRRRQMVAYMVAKWGQMFAYRVVFLRALNLSSNPVSRTGCLQGSVIEGRVACNYPRTDQIRPKWGQIGLNSSKIRGFSATLLTVERGEKWTRSG